MAARVMNGTVRAGDMVAWAVRNGSHHVVRIGRVVRVRADGGTISVRATHPQGTRTVTLVRLDKVVKIRSGVTDAE